jgi:hypothetical protein
MIMLLVSCEKHKDEVPGLAGTWIGTYNNDDTIVFKSSSVNGLFILNRGYETRNGYLLPKLGSGLYSYNISGESINVISSVSSLGTGNNVYFKLNESEKKFQIGIFTSGFITNLYIVEFKNID